MNFGRDIKNIKKIETQEEEKKLFLKTIFFDAQGRFLDTINKLQ